MRLLLLLAAACFSGASGSSRSLVFTQTASTTRAVPTYNLTTTTTTYMTPDMPLAPGEVVFTEAATYKVDIRGCIVCVHVCCACSS